MNKLRGLLGIGLVVVLTVVVGVGLWYISKPMVKKITNFQECADAGYPVMESYPRQCRTPKGDSFTEDIGNGLELTDLIQVEMPLPNEAITSRVLVRGKARGNWFFEGSFPVKLVVNGEVIAQTVAEAQGEWMTNEFVDFKAILDFEDKSSTEARRGDLILEKDNPSGLPENDKSLRIPVIIGSERISVSVYFNSSDVANYSDAQCQVVIPVQRFAGLQLAERARGALEELLKGPTEEEKAKGFFTSINPNVKIQKFSIEDGVAKVDFDKQMEFQMGGSCRVAAIRAQITQTLKQFPEIKDVIISVDGRTEDILQP